MNYIETMYNELSDLKGSIILLKEDAKNIDNKFHDILKEVRDTDFDLIQSINMYKNIQNFLQERRLLKSKIEEMEIQYEILGGDEQLKTYSEALDFKQVKRNTKFNKDNKYYRNKKYYSNFREDLKEQISSLYHIV